VSTLVDKVAEELKKAMLAKDSARTNGFRMIRAALIELAKDGKGDVTDERATEALRRLRKQREDAIAEYVKAGRADLAEGERAEMAIVDELLPKLADEDTTRAWVRDAIAASGAAGPRDMGKAMGALMKAHKADVDAAVARRLLEEALGA
jgi:uncharacterized protein YqeY